ncbi:ABC transporter substrate-binding protein [Actinopolymorpha pittospori]|uniref:Iron complex transport system substrate-binding protein n=1 Tax=Actinopolymorpha pittospori TaxID=648752 RepID=A0A927R887_9ACTN|nr:iron-siderophore ABC transporter substrate-binding protein [Actinopolymorpha pittospori]MBE1605089.1 iron complex transport system substrate-binding protein [Actinopolymorpha pittospori]
MTNSRPPALRRLATTFAPLIAVLALAVGCGGGAATTDSSGGDAAGGGAGDSAKSDTGFPRTVKHAMGSTEIPTKPKRVVALDSSFVDDTLLLNTPVVGFTSYRAISDELPSYLGPARETLGKDAVSVGSLEEPSLEKIVALKPDLIVTAKVRHEALYDKLSAIAPTIMSESSGPTWKSNITLLAKALGEEKLAATKIAAYEQRAKAIGDAINAKADNPTISVVRFVDGPTRLYTKLSFSGIVLTDAGLARPKPQDVADPANIAIEISEERIPDADADHIFVTTYADDAGSSAKTKTKFEANPLWKRLKGEVHDVDDALWMTPCSIQGADYILDDLAKTFGVDAQRG